MRTTIRDQVLNTLTAEYPGTLTNNQLAVRLSLNKPSVRRATNELLKAGQITDYAGGYSNLPIQWQGAPPTADNVQIGNL